MIDPMQLVRDIAAGKVFLPSDDNKEEKVMNPELIQRAALIVATMETPGGKALLEEMEKLANQFCLKPENFIKRDAVTGATSVDVCLVSVMAGARMAFDEIKRLVNKCGKIVEGAAKKAETSSAVESVTSNV